MRLPTIRQELADIELQLSIIVTRLAALNQQIKRRSPIKRAPPKADKLTPEEKAEARKLYFGSNLSQFEIAKRLGCNPGRISEAVRGKRE